MWQSANPFYHPRYNVFDVIRAIKTPTWIVQSLLLTLTTYSKLPCDDVSAGDSYSASINGVIHFIKIFIPTNLWEQMLLSSSPEQYQIGFC